MEKATAKEITAIVLPNGESIPPFDAYLDSSPRKPDTRLILEMKSLSDYNRETSPPKKIVRQLKKYGVLDPDGDHRLLDQRLHGVQEAHSRHPNLLPQRRPGSQEHQELGLAGIDYSMGVLRKHPQWVKGGARSGSRSQRLDRGFGGGHDVFHRAGRGLPPPSGLQAQAEATGRFVRQPLKICINATDAGIAEPRARRCGHCTNRHC